MSLKRTAGMLAFTAALFLSVSPALAGSYGATAKENPTPAVVAAPAFVYDCPAAGCSYEAGKPGLCPQHKLKLQKMALSYTCPKDDKAVAGPGKCPRCAADAVAHKMAMADAKTHKTRTKKVNRERTAS